MISTQDLRTYAQKNVRKKVNRLLSNDDVWAQFSESSVIVWENKLENNNRNNKF